jgi:phosphoheptose isomerase
MMRETPLAIADLLTRQHVGSLARALEDFRREAERLSVWGRELAAVLAGGGRLLVAGNGGSAAEAQHLAAELVGKMRDDRRPYSAIALTAETPSLTAIGNDYGFDEVFARQVHAHGRRGDVLVTLSTSGGSANLLAADRAARAIGVRSWALTGPAPNPLAESCDDVVAVPSPDSQTVQELHLVCVHLLCRHVEAGLSGRGANSSRQWRVEPHRERREPDGHRERGEPNGHRERSEPYGHRERSEPNGDREWIGHLERSGQ